MTNEEVKEIIDRAEDEYDRLKDRVHEQYDEIERLNNIIETKDEGIKAFAEELCETTEELDIYKSIIKEVREYINKNGIIDLNGYDLLEILDKEKK